LGFIQQNHPIFLVVQTQAKHHPILDGVFALVWVFGTVDLKGSGSEWRAGGTPEPRNGPPAGGQIHLPPPTRKRKLAVFYFYPTFSSTHLANVSAFC